MSLILAIESSCDETAVAVVRDGVEVLCNKVATQIDLHRAFGGVRASLYNALPIESVDALTQFMAEFARTHG